MLCVMYSQSQWLDLYKFRLSIGSDYRLAKRWGLPQSYISQYRRERLRLPLALMLMIAEELEIEPLEIISALEIKRTSEKFKEAIKGAYFDALVKTIGVRMSESSIPRYSCHWRNR